MAMVIKVAFVISVIILMVLEFFGKYGSFVNEMILKWDFKFINIGIYVLWEIYLFYSNTLH